jgi:hypothetical protein
MECSGQGSREELKGDEVGESNRGLCQVANDVLSALCGKFKNSEI